MGNTDSAQATAVSDAKSVLRKDGKLKSKFYTKELARLQEELIKLQYWVQEKGLRVVILFEGRDAAGKGAAAQEGRS